MTNRWLSALQSLSAFRRSPRQTEWKTIGLLMLVLLLGGYLRTLNLFGWDGDSYLHPDERFLIFTVNNLTTPRSFGDYWQSSCDARGSMVSPKNPSEPPERQEPTRDSGCNTLNPRNYNWSPFFVYGTLPTTLNRLVSEARQLTEPENLRNTGRALSTLFDLGSMVLVFLIGRRLYGSRVGLLAGLFLALSVLPIQLAHFFTVDAASACLTLLSIYWAVRIAQGGQTGSFVAFGLSVGATMACRITLATLGLVGLLALVVRFFGEARQDTDLVADGDTDLRYRRRRLVPFLQLVLAGVLAFFTFRTLQPDAFVGSRADAPFTPALASAFPTLEPLLTPLDHLFQGRGFFDMRPEPRFLDNIHQIGLMISGEVDAPPSQQWAGRTAFLFAWQNMVLWGMGVPLGLAAWIGWAVAGWQLIRRRALVHLVPWGWIAFYFLWQGGQFVMTMRYYSLLYGLLAIFAAWLLVGNRERRGAQPQLLPGTGIRSLAPYLAALVVVLATALWAYAFTRIYTQPHSRIMASRWIYDNIPPGSNITSEQWDDPLPLSIDGRSYNRYIGVSMFPYYEDDQVKYTGQVDQQGKQQPGLLDQLDQADYLIFSSNRVYDSATRMPMRYPILTRYYHALFNGELGFKLVADIHSYPHLFGFEIPTPVYAEEAFSVYDHPRVLIFQKTPDYSRARAEQLITDGALWSEVYKLPTVRASRVPSALRLTDQQWPGYREQGTWADLFHPSGLSNWLPWLPWLIVLELLGLAAFALLFRLLPGLPDRGFALSKTLGLLVVAYGAWLPASVGAADGSPLLSFSPLSLRLCAGLFILLGALVAWRSRDDLLAFGHRRRTTLLTAEGLFLVAFFGFLLLRALNPDLWHPARGGEKPMDLAFLNAVLKSAAFPPYDPWFAGGYINYYYFGFVLVGALIHITGVVPTSAYNLAIPTIFALTALGAWGAAYNLLAPRLGRASEQARLRAEQLVATGIAAPNPLRHTPRARRNQQAILAGVIAAIFVVLLGNLAQVAWFMPGSADPSNPMLAGECQGLSSYAAQQACRGRSEWAFWDATRLVGMALSDSTINEFPFFTFLYGDLHAHMLALPLALAALGLMVALVRRTERSPWSRQGLAALALLALTVGALRATNTWDYPTYLGLSILTLALVAWDRWRRGVSWVRASRDWALGALLLVLLSSLLFLEFTRHFATDYAGFQLWHGMRTPVAEFLKINGLWLFLLVSAVLIGYRRGGSALHSRIVAALLLAGLLIAQISGLISIGVLVLLVVLGGGALALLISQLSPDEDDLRPVVSLSTMLVTIWGMAALGLTLLVEIAVAKGDIGRMNSVFKFGMQSWVLFALPSALALSLLWRRVMDWRPGLGWAWRVIAGLLIAGALVYPLTATPARLADRFDPQIGPTLDGAAYMRSEKSSWGENGHTFTFAQDADALDWMRRTISGTPVVLEAQTEGYRWGGRVSIYTGLPTLLGWPWHETQQRSVVQVTPVLASRQELVKQLYNSAAGDDTLQLLRNYGVEYVYVGQLERALYDPAGLAKFETLANSKQIETVYSAGETRIYHVPASDRLPGMLTTSLAVRAPALAPEKTLMLDRPVSELPAVDEYGWNRLGQSSLGALVLWLLAGYGLVLLGLPLAALVFGRWRDGGYTWARLIGLLLLGYAVWLPVSIKLWSYNLGGLLAGALIVLGLDALLLHWAWRRPGVGGLRALRDHVLNHRREIALVEGLFLGAFVVMAGIRALNPDLWQPIWGGEKPFEFAFFNAILRSPVMPPYNPFFSDGTINYYYYGLFLVSLPVKATGIAPEIGFNLIIASLFALTVIGAFTIVVRLSGRARYGLLGVAFVAIVGNLAAVFPSGWSSGIKPVIEALQAGLSGFGTHLDAWFVGPSRVIPNTINEFPYWSFLFADLHPHLIALPMTLLMVALAYTLFTQRARGAQQQDADWAGVGVWGLAALTLGALAVTNSWDFPTYALLLVGALIGAAGRSGAPAGLDRIMLFGRALVIGVLIAAGGLLLYLPFFQSYQAMVRGVAPVQNGSPLGAYLLIYGMFLAVLAPATFGALWRLQGHARPARQPAEELLPPAALGFAAPSLSRVFHSGLPQKRILWVGLALLLLLVAALQPVLGLKLWLAALLIASLLILRSRRSTPATWFAFWMAVVGWAVSLGIEFIFIRDHLAGGDWARMNTVFKFGMQVWVLLALAAATLVPLLMRGLRRHSQALEGVGWGFLVVLVALGLVFPLAGTPSRVSYRFPDAPGPTLDGLAFLQSATYDWEGHLIDLRPDGEAIRWLKDTISGTPVILQSSMEFYRAYGVRIAANTGFPTVVSPLHENEQRDPAAVDQRDRDVREIYMTSDGDRALRLLSKYRVQYVYIGPIERTAYGEAGAAKFDALNGSYLDLVYSNEAVKIYKVNQAVYSLNPSDVITFNPPPGTKPSDRPVAPVAQPSLATLRKQVEADPTAAGPAFGLAQALRELNRLEEAAAVLAPAAAAHPNDTPLHHLWGDILRDAGHQDAAEIAYRQAAEATPTTGNYNKLGVELIKMGRLEKAEAAFIQALSLGDQEPAPLYHLGQIYEQQGKRQQAIERYNQYLRLASPDAPNRKEASDALERLKSE